MWGEIATHRALCGTCSTRWRVTTLRAVDRDGQDGEDGLLLSGIAWAFGKRGV